MTRRPDDLTAVARSLLKRLTASRDAYPYRGFMLDRSDRDVAIETLAAYVAAEVELRAKQAELDHVKAALGRGR